MPNREASTGMVAYTGSAYSLFFLCLLFVASFKFFVPIPWELILFIPWLASKLSWRGVRGKFVGKWTNFPLQTGLMALLVIAHGLVVPQLTRQGVFPHRLGFLLFLGLVFANFFPAYYYLVGIVGKIQLEDGETFEFTGSLRDFLWRSAVLLASVYTFIGFPWGVTYFLRWLCPNIKGRRTTFTYEGLGKELFWKAIPPMFLYFFSMAPLFMGSFGLENSNSLLLQILRVICMLLLLAMAFGIIIALPWHLSRVLRWIIGSIQLHCAELQADPAADPAADAATDSATHSVAKAP